MPHTVGPTVGRAMYDAFLGTAPHWYKATLIIFLVANPVDGFRRGTNRTGTVRSSRGRNQHRDQYTKCSDAQRSGRIFVLAHLGPRAAHSSGIRAHGVDGIALYDHDDSCRPRRRVRLTLMREWINKMTGAVWQRHANPWSVYTRFAAILAALLVAFGSTVKLGHRTLPQTDLAPAMQAAKLDLAA